MKKNLIFLLLAIGILSCVRKQSPESAYITEEQAGFMLIGENNQPEAEKAVILKPDSFNVTILQFGDMDGDGLTDTLKTVLSLKADTIYLVYSWEKYGRLVWTEMFQTHISVFSDYFEEDWVNFVTEGSTPGFYKIEEYLQIIDYYSEITVTKLKEEGFNITKEEYEDYIRNFNGNLLSYGLPYYNTGLYVWYEPLKMFVLYYHP